MSARGRPKRRNQGRRPAWHDEEPPRGSGGASRQQQAKKRRVAVEEPSSPGEDDSQDAWYENVGTSAARDARPEGMEEALLNRLRVLEEALGCQAARQKGQALDSLAITVPPEVKEKILLGKFVEMHVLLAKSFLDRPEEKAVMFVQNEQGNLVPRLERKNKTELTINQWTTAFHVLMSVYLQQHPDRLQDMLAYVELIRGAARDNPGNAWLLYDQQFRSRLEADPTRPWGMIDSQLWLQLFCKPVVAAPAGKVSPAVDQKGGAYAGKGQRGVCRFFNRPKGCQRDNCAYAHKCAQCSSSSHGQSTCAKKGTQDKGETSSGRPFQSTTGQKAQ
ncbi:hypothetical protein V1264_009177 [Littorina saxatilis]|uniref:C3H1-type domain-containing protein n=1 Tax=Littorina saxatilis TaxID=31220 RepID=A0AAN9AR61_9CAEN